MEASSSTTHTTTTSPPNLVSSFRLDFHRVYIMSVPPVRTFSVLATYKALRLDLAGLRGALRRLWDGRRVFDVKLERDWAIVSFTTEPAYGASIEQPSTASLTPQSAYPPPPPASSSSSSSSVPSNTPSAETADGASSPPTQPRPPAAGGFSPIDVHVGVSRRGSMVVYNHGADKNPAYQVEGVL